MVNCSPMRKTATRVLFISEGTTELRLERQDSSADTVLLREFRRDGTRMRTKTNGLRKEGRSFKLKNDCRVYRSRSMMTVFRSRS